MPLILTDYIENPYIVYIPINAHIDILHKSKFSVTIKVRVLIEGS